MFLEYVDFWPKIFKQSLFLGPKLEFLIYPKQFVATKVNVYSPKLFLFEGEHDYLRMLREAQRESNRSSSKVSPISSAFISVKTTPAGS